MTYWDSLDSSLNDLENGCSGTIVDVEGGDDETVRLKEMGFCRGRRITLERRGDPVIVSVLGSRMGLSARLAARIRVAITEPSP